MKLMVQHFGRRRNLLLVVALFLLSMGVAMSEDATPGEPGAEADAEADAAVKETLGEAAAKDATEDQSIHEPPKVIHEEPYFNADPSDWGTYYDPKGEFCGDYDCYRILGFDYESFGREHPDTKEITKRYRKLSRKWHPDKNPSKTAKERFVKIARAYEVLTSKEKREEYDFMRYNQEAYFQKYGTSVLWSYAPQSDTLIVVVFLLIAINVFSWFAQKTRWQNVADRLVKAAIEDWSPSQGGSPESKELREHALAVLAEREAAEEQNGATSDDKGTPGKKAKGKGKKVSGKERKKQEQDSLLPIIKELVEEMHDFGGGFHKPTWEDLMIVSMVKFPFKFAKGVAWQTKYWARRLQGQPLNDHEKEVLTERAVGPVTWDLATEDQRQEMIKRELWILDNLVEYREEEEIKNLPSWMRKQVEKERKKEKAKQS